jgi:hypothetical protein
MASAQVLRLLWSVHPSPQWWDRHQQSLWHRHRLSSYVRHRRRSCASARFACGKPYDILCTWSPLVLDRGCSLAGGWMAGSLRGAPLAPRRVRRSAELQEMVRRVKRDEMPIDLGEGYTAPGRR